MVFFYIVYLTSSSLLSLDDSPDIASSLVSDDKASSSIPTKPETHEESDECEDIQIKSLLGSTNQTFTLTG